MARKFARGLKTNILRAPGLYVGHEWDINGLHFLVLEIIRLAVKPESANTTSSLAVTITPNGELFIVDNGRGLLVTPIRIGESEERPIVEHVATWIFERHPDSKYHEEFGFLNYLGAVLNAVSEHLYIETTTGGDRYALTCSRGRVVQPLQKLGPSSERGTLITFVPDPEVFGDLTFENDRLIEGLERLAVEYPHVQFSYEDKRSDKKITFSSA